LTLCRRVVGDPRRVAVACGGGLPAIQQFPVRLRFDAECREQFVVPPAVERYVGKLFLEDSDSHESDIGGGHLLGSGSFHEPSVTQSIHEPLLNKGQASSRGFRRDETSARLPGFDSDRLAGRWGVGDSTFDDRADRDKTAADHGAGAPADSNVPALEHLERRDRRICQVLQFL
jgi:hypothetical protein